MSLIVKNTGNSDFVILEAGVYIGTVVSLVDIGEQYSEKYGNYTRNVIISWELAGVTVEINGETKPRIISKEYNMSFNEKAHLRKDLESFRGRKFNNDELSGFDLRNILNKSCQLQIINLTKGDKVFANIGAIMSLSKGTPAPTILSTITFIDLDDKDSVKQIDTLPKWIADKIKNSKTYEKNQHLLALDVSDDPDLPF